MKCTKSISLAILASMTAVTLTACSKPQPSLEGQKIFTSVKDCEKSGVKNCKMHHDRAAYSHLLKAPRYTSNHECKKAGHQECSDLSLEGVAVWLPKMVGFMGNDRPVYLQGYDQKTVEYEDEDGYINERPLTSEELKERAVVAGPSVFDRQDDDYDRTSIVVLGGWYPSPYYYSYGFSPARLSLADGMRTSYVRAHSSNGRSLTLSRNYVPSAQSSTVRGSVRGYGRATFASSRPTTSVRGGFGGGGRGFGGG